MEEPAKHARLLRLIDDLRGLGIHLAGVGIQGHWGVGYVPIGEINALLLAMKDRGLKVMVSELDLDVVPRAPRYANDGRGRTEVAKSDPLAGGCPPDLEARQARQYADLFRLFVARAESIGRVTFWNLLDGPSWLNEHSRHHAEYPLLFDRQSTRKPAYHAVMNLP